MRRVDGVVQVIRERFQIAQRGGEREGIGATDPRDVAGLGLQVASGTGDLRDGTVLVSRTWAREQQVAVGDPVAFTVPSGTERYLVVGTFEDNPVVFFPVLTTLRTLEDAGFPPADNALIVFGDGRPGLQDRLERVVADLPVVTVKDEAQFAQEQRAPIDQLVLMIFALLGLALVIAVLGIVNTLALSIIERTREIGLLRAIGVSRRQLWQMITLESVVISVLGALLGVVLGIGFGVALMYALRDQGLEAISVPVPLLAVFLALSLVVGVLAAVFPARRAARLDVLRAIATD
jgi:putative ABC transport system permease protein